jgi:cytochrome c-type biogenesis protein CcmH/NrfG
MTRELKQMNQCLYCLTQALRLDPSDVEALWELATIHRDQGNKLKVSLSEVD